ncbi:PAS and ANTAR domain-containing protein [Oerskovia sp. NPDC060338]|uniref:PAS and ANTAR domain-containing protein n=1 Tax=Oerskovia sp. NPDC060338 TaxID=3347100 RepID=UPI0036521907
MLEHKHPDDRSRVESVLEQACAAGHPFACVHRIIDAHGHSRTLGVVGRGRKDSETKEVLQVSGYFVDLTITQRRLARREADASIRASAASRGVIEHAKGAVVTVYGMSEDEAFDVLRQHSYLTNVSLRDLARQLMERIEVGSTTPGELDLFFETPLPPDHMAPAESG